MHVAKFRSLGDAALQAGNSEAIIRKHYLDVKSPAEAFWNVLPGRSREMGEVGEGKDVLVQCGGKDVEGNAKPVETEPVAAVHHAPLSAEVMEASPQAV
jgi:hypothetical protein